MWDVTTSGVNLKIKKVFLNDVLELEGCDRQIWKDLFRYLCSLLFAIHRWQNGHNLSLIFASLECMLYGIA